MLLVHCNKYCRCVERGLSKEIWLVAVWQPSPRFPSLTSPALGANTMPRLTAQFQFRVGQDNMCVVHVSLVPVIGVVGEQKTKPTQHSVQVLRSLGLNPNILACRCEKPLEDAVREKLVSSCIGCGAVGGGRMRGGGERQPCLLIWHGVWL